jgi:hypothetical protein
MFNKLPPELVLVLLGGWRTQAQAQAQQLVFAGSAAKATAA